MTELEIIHEMAERIIKERGKTYTNILDASIREFGFNIGAKFYRFERNDLFKLTAGKDDINPDTTLDLINYLIYCLIKTGAYKKHPQYKRIISKTAEKKEKDNKQQGLIYFNALRKDR